MNNCRMCGKDSTSLVNRWYEYDNGERFIAAVCSSCDALHAKLVA